MTGASKILTVSYGTFSCTLEGFDDPFNTMRAIAEYFRDLAADDRYFGAEPPTPDAAMLHRIAEREVQRRVDAKVQDNGIHLRAAEAPAPAPQPAPIPAVADTTPAAETIAERLLRLRSDVAAQQQAAPVPVPQPVVAATVTLPEYTEDLGDEPAMTAATALSGTLSDTLPEDHPEADLSAPLAALDPLPEDAPEDAPGAEALNDLPETLLAALAGPASELPAAEPAPAAAPAAAEDRLASTLSAVLASAAPAAPVAQTEAADPLAFDAFTEDAPSAPFAEQATELPPETDISLTADLDADFDAGDDEPAGLDSIFGEAEDLPPAQPLPELRPGAAEKLQRARARVFRIRRADAAGDAAAPAALDASGEADLERELAALRDAGDAPAEPHPFAAPSTEDAVSRLMAQADSEMEGEETKRRQSAIAHLKAAVAQTVAERRAGEAKPDPQPSRIARYRNDLAMVVRAALPGAAPAPKPQGERPAPLVLVSEQRIDRPPRPAGGPIPAVPAAPAAAPAAPPIRPRRVSSGTGSGLAMQAQAFAADDFDDLDAALEEALADPEDTLAEPAETAPLAQEAGFRDFAERLGATSLRDMIEAAASWLTCEQKRESFTRPQLMRHVGIVIPQTDSLREDSLRVFGALLRDGHIVKVRRGQFALADLSPYHFAHKRNPG